MNMQKIAKVQATRTQAPAELALLIIANDLSGGQPCLEDLPVSCLGALAPVVVIQIQTSNMLKVCQLLWSNLVKMHSETKSTHMCGLPSHIHLSPQSDPVKRIAVLNLLPLQSNEAVKLAGGEMSCMKKQ